MRGDDDAAAASSAEQTQPSTTMRFDREFALVDCVLEFRELMAEGSPLEVYAVDPQELSSVNGVAVPDYGAFVARVLTPDVTSGGLPEYTNADEAWPPPPRDDDDNVGEDDKEEGGAAAAGTSAGTTSSSSSMTRITPVWCRDSRGGAVVVPKAQVGPLRDHETSLIMLGEDWYILGGARSAVHQAETRLTPWLEKRLWISNQLKGVHCTQFQTYFCLFRCNVSTPPTPRSALRG